jgi:hypothetical protein
MYKFGLFKKSKAGSIAIKEILMLVILDVIALALVPTIATSATSASGNLTTNPGAQSMVGIVVVFYIIVILVFNAVVVIHAVNE